MITLPAYQVPPHLKKYFRQHLCSGCYVCHIVEVFREVKRTLRDDGTLWLNLGDSYASSTSTGHGGWDGNNKNPDGSPRQSRQAGDKWMRTPTAVSGLKPKDLVGIPWRVAFALQADGWYLRSDIIWHKPNCMPESVRDRPTKSHEYLFLLSKSKRYYYDQDAIREPHKWDHVGAYRLGKASKNRGSVEKPVQGQGNTTGSFRAFANGGRNRRTVWTIPTKPFKEAHFATFPPKLIEPCIKAGTSAKGACPKCGRGWIRIVEKTGHVNKREPAHVPNNVPTKTDSTGWAPTTSPTDRWQPACACNAGDPIPQVILDPFMGAGTTAVVAVQLGRDYFGIEINPEYCEMARQRIANEQPPLFVM